MNIAKFNQGLQILLSYLDNQESEWLSAEHDIIYFPETSRELSESDYDILISLGWNQHEPEEQGVYDPNAGWYAFT